MIGLFIGRFQPFHKGHLWAVRKILMGNERLIIGIGSTQEKCTSTNPYSAPERREMILSSLNPEERDRIIIFEIPDVEQDQDWVPFVKELVPKFDNVYTGSALMATLFRQAGHQVVDLPRHKGISATEIRLRIAKGMPWKSMVEKPVASIIDMIGKGRIILPKLPSASKKSPSSARCPRARALRTP